MGDAGKRARPDCFGYYDDGDGECERCPYSDDCFKAGAA